MAPDILQSILTETLDHFAQATQNSALTLTCQEVGTLTFVGNGMARATGLPQVQSQEQVRFADGSTGLAFNLDVDEVGLVLLDRQAGLMAGGEVQRTGQVLNAPVGEGLLGRVIDAMGRSLDRGEPIPVLERRPIERAAPAIMDRVPVTVPLQTGIKVIDALVPIGRGQRQLILGDRQTGQRLPGTGQQILIQLLENSGQTVTPRPWTPDWVSTLEAIAYSNSVIGLIPIRQGLDADDTMIWQNSNSTPANELLKLWQRAIALPVHS